MTEREVKIRVGLGLAEPALSKVAGCAQRSEVKARWLVDPQSAPAGVIQAVMLHALQLRQPYREAFILCDIQGRSVPEAAMLLGVQPSAVTSRLVRARRQLSEVTRGLCEQ